MMVIIWTAIKAFLQIAPGCSRTAPEAPSSTQEPPLQIRLLFRTVPAPAELPTENYSLHSPENYAELLFEKARGQNTIPKQ